MTSVKENRGTNLEASLALEKEWPTVTSIPGLVKLIDGAISESSLYERAKQGSLPGCRRVGHRFLCHVPKFFAWLQSGTGDEQEIQNVEP